MARQLVPIKVVIEDGRHFKYPDFNALPVVKTWSAANGGDWSNYIDVEGTGWKYDNIGSFARDDGETPQGKWCALLFIPKQFAQEATSIFPDLVTVLDETACEIFYETRHAAEFPDENVDNEILTGIKLKQDLGLNLTPNQNKALDPTDNTPGIRKNKDKKWADFKGEKNIEVIGVV